MENPSVMILGDALAKEVSSFCRYSDITCMIRSVLVNGGTVTYRPSFFTRMDIFLAFIRVPITILPKSSSDIILFVATY